jgi:predicted glycosyltransferase involved in capsule biosynthesis
LPDEQRWIGYGMGHFDLLHRADAYARIRSWLDDGRAVV